MSRLIDADLLYKKMTEEYKKNYAGTGKGEDFTIAMQMVQNQPTAYDVEKVVELLKDWTAEADIVRPFDNKVITGKKVIASENAIGIVRDGGV